MRISAICVCLFGMNVAQAQQAPSGFKYESLNVLVPDTAPTTSVPSTSAQTGGTTTNNYYFSSPPSPNVMYEAFPGPAFGNQMSFAEAQARARSYGNVWGGGMAHPLGCACGSPVCVQKKERWIRQELITEFYPAAPAPALLPPPRCRGNLFGRCPCRLHGGAYINTRVGFGGVGVGVGGGVW